MQNYESEITLIFAVKVFAMIMMVILLAKHVIDLWGRSKVLPFISLILTPLIVMHVFTLDIKLAEVVKLQIKDLFKVLTYDFFDTKSRMNGKELKIPQLQLIGY